MIKICFTVVAIQIDIHSCKFYVMASIQNKFARVERQPIHEDNLIVHISLDV